MSLDPHATAPGEDTEPTGARLERTDPPLPERIGPYRVARLLARGGMGVVYVAQHPTLEREVAVKVTPRELLGPSAASLERSRREARALGRLRHPNVVGVHDAGQDEAGRWYLAMDLIDGEPLKARLGRGPLEAREAATLVARLARALHHAHARGVLHRDVKPSNVILEAATGEPVLTDFGLARDAAGTATALTATGEALGTPAYMAPEQVDARAGDVDARTDVYGLGATLFEALTGRPPFAGGSSVAVLHAVLSKAPPAPSSLRAGVSRELDAVCLRCLEKAPERRYASAEALALALEAWLAGPGTPTSAAGPGDVEPWRVAAVFAVVSVTLTLTLLLGWSARSAQADREAARAGPAGGVPAPSPSPAGQDAALVEAALRGRAARRALAGALVERGFAALDAGRPDEAARAFAGATEALRALAADAPGPEDDGGDAASLRVQAERGAREACAQHGLVRRPAAPGGVRVHATAFTPDGDLLLLGPDAVVRCAAARSFAPGLAQPLSGGRGWALSPDGRTLATASETGVTLFDAATAQVTSSIDAPGAPRWAVAFSTDGRRVVAGGEDGGVVAWDLVEGRVTGWLAETGWSPPALDGMLRSTAPVHACAFDPAGRTLAVAQVGRVTLWDPATGALLRRLVDPVSPPAAGEAHRRDVWDCAFSPDGRWLATVGWDGLGKLWDPATGALVSTLAAADTSESGACAFSPDGASLAVTGTGVVLVWDLERRRVVRRIADPAGLRLPDVAWSPDGRLLATVDGTGAATVWSALPSRSPVVVDGLPLRQGALCCAFLADGALVYPTGATLELWRGRHGSEPGSRDGTPSTLLRNLVEGGPIAAVVASGQRVAVSAPGEVRLWDARTWSEVASLDAAASPPALVALGGERVAVASAGRVTVWEVARGRPRRVIVVEAPEPRSLALSSDGRTLVVCTWRHALVVSVDGGEPRALDVEAPVRCAISPDGRLAAVATGGGQVGLWALARGGPASAPATDEGGLLPPGRLGTEVGSLAFSPDGALLAAGAAGRVVMWDVTAGRVVWRVEGHESRVPCVAFSPDGRRLASVGTDGRVLLWDVEASALPGYEEDPVGVVDRRLRLGP